MKNKKEWLFCLMFIVSMVLTNYKINNVKVIAIDNNIYLEGNNEDPYAYMDYETPTRSIINGDEVSQKTGLELTEVLSLPYFLDSYLSKFNYNDSRYNIVYVDNSYTETETKKNISITVKEIPSIQFDCEYRLKDKIWSFKQINTGADNTKLVNNVTTNPSVVPTVQNTDLYENVSVVTNFESNININNVGVIGIKIQDGDGHSLYYELSTDNNYKVNANNAFTYSDLTITLTVTNSEKYAASYSVDYSNDENPVINIKVSQLAGGDDNNSTSNDNTYSNEEINDAQNTVKDRNTRYSLYKVIFFVVLVFIVVVLCIAGIKILNANK